MKYYIAILFCMITPFVVSCSSELDENDIINPSGSENFEPLVLTENQENINNGINEEVRELFLSYCDQCSQEPRSFNWVKSPLNHITYLAMVLNGAEDSIQDEILNKTGAKDIGALNSYIQLVSDHMMKADSKVKMVSHNSFWTDSRLEVNPEYLTVLQDYYRAQTYTKDFGSTSGSLAVNKWISNVYNGLMNDLLPLERPYEKNYFLASVMLFDGRWQKKFTTTETKMFYNQDGGTPKVTMMAGEFFNVDCTSSPDYIMGKIPYGNGSYTMTLILPSKGITPMELIKKEGTELFNAACHATNLELTMPIMDIQQSFDLTQLLKNHGYASLMDTSRPLSNMGEAGYPEHYGLPASISAQLRIIMDPNGTKVLSTTHSDGLVESAGYTKILDRPFITYISEKSTGTLILPV